MSARKTPVTIALLLLGVANAVAPDILTTIRTFGAIGGLANTFGVSVITVAAAIAGVVLARRSPARPLDSVDRFAIVLYATLLVLPFAGTSMMALLLFASYAMVRSSRSSEQAAAFSMFAGIGATGVLLGPLFHLFAQPLLALDAAMASGLLGVAEPGVTHLGNLVEGAGQPLLVAAGCSSASLIAQALLCWLVVVRVARPAWTRRDLACLPALAAATLGVNVVRIAAMGYSRSAYEIVHGQVGIDVTNLLAFGIAGVAAWWTVGSPPMAMAPVR